MTDIELENKIEQLQIRIISWAEEKGIWEGTSFHSYAEYFEDEPLEGHACVMVLRLDGHFFTMFNEAYDEYRDQLDEIVEESEFYYEHSSNEVLMFYCKEEELNKLYQEYFEWKWICELVKPDYISLYGELYEYFNKRPEQLYSLGYRQFEILISEVFRNQGYQTELGSGRNDKGVDVRLYQKEGIDRIVTLVQVKRYRHDRAIGLEAVSSLSGIVNQEGADQGLFVTTSRYLPSAKNFASRENKKLILADSGHVSEWCRNANFRIERDKSKVLTKKYILGLLQRKEGLVGQVVISTGGINRIVNQFCLIVKDSPHVVLLLKISGRPVEYYDPPYNFYGGEVPVLDERILACIKKENVFRAKKNISFDGEISFWGNHQLYSIWDGKPAYFELLD